MPKRSRRGRKVPQPPWYASALFPTEADYLRELQQLRADCEMQVDKIQTDRAGEARRLGCSTVDTGEVRDGYQTVLVLASSLDNKYGKYKFWYGERHRSDEFLWKLRQEYQLLCLLFRYYLP